eukprot:scaffold9232_cov129-Isochrysis_galbana.AAC.3
MSAFTSTPFERTMNDPHRLMMSGGWMSNLPRGPRESPPAYVLLFTNMYIKNGSRCHVFERSINDIKIKGSVGERRSLSEAEKKEKTGGRNGGLNGRLCHGMAPHWKRLWGCKRAPV